MNSSMIPIWVAVLFGGWVFLSFIGAERARLSNDHLSARLRREAEEDFVPTAKAVPQLSAAPKPAAKPAAKPPAPAGKK